MMYGGWGTWEELILGGAVLRHGTGDWTRVASEITTRTPTPAPGDWTRVASEITTRTPTPAFTPQACKERFQDLQKRYCSGSSSSTAWFDELRKRRVAELKQQLAKSENSIGSLESKIKYLEVEKQYSNQVESETHESRLPALDSEATESISKQTSNDANSIGSFTKRTGARVESDPKAQEKDKFVEMGYGGCVIMRKKRSQRKRKERNQGTSVCESDNLGSCNAPKGTSTTNENEITRISGTITRDNFIQIFKSIAQSEAASVFKHRMDSQKRARYRRVIKQHMDIGTIRSRMTGQSAKEVFRDLLLVANNALVFYSRRTREYKSAVTLRVLVMKEYKKLFVRGYCCSHEATSAFIPCNPPVKPRTARPHPRPVTCKHDFSVVVPAADTTRTRLGPEKQCSTIANNNKKVINVSKGMKRQGKVMKPVDPPAKTIPLKQTKRLRR